jgi:maleylacetoacetate isomerase
MKLYTYWRSSAAYRVRIALNLKTVPHSLVPVNLLQGEHQSGSYSLTNPYGLVPALETDDGQVLQQSFAIIEWLEEVYPEPALLPSNALERARARGWALSIACEVHPLNNVGVTHFLRTDLGADDAAVTAWMNHWFERVFKPLEADINAAPYCLGDKVSLADVFLVPQVYNALRFGFDMSDYPRLLSVYQACNALPSFTAAAPERQADAVTAS